MVSVFLGLFNCQTDMDKCYGLQMRDEQPGKCPEAADGLPW